jgi:ABC-type amino acid transport substrate-binding protein
MLPMEGVGDELVMGYRTNERLPFIDDETNNGIYLDLFGEACRKIGVALKVVRLPKVRVAHALQQGTVDFYPGYSFTVERASHITFFPNGLMERYVVVNRLDDPPISAYENLIGKTEIRSLGNPSFLPAAIQSQVKSSDAGELGIARALRMVDAGRVDFFIYDETTLRYYWPRLNTAKLRLNDSLDRLVPMYTGWSKKSPHLKFIKNPKYLSDKALSAENQPEIPDPQSLAGRLEAALLSMNQSGETKAIIRKHMDMRAPGP